MFLPAAGNKWWKYIFLCHMFLSSPEQHILKKVQKVLPSFTSNAFSVLFFGSFMVYLLNCPCPIQLQFCQIHFTALVFTICFPILFFLNYFLAHFHYRVQFNCFLHANLKRKYKSYTYSFLSRWDFMKPFPILIKIMLIFSRFWFCNLLFIKRLIPENLEILMF